ncbi:MAG: PUA-like domain-containing protein [Olpidium bornovanus]|uniref:PUA-like domain-containing protein n=1 Tax=Olpidium bornovanus TaxID=278681 RepID=A0A8H7ZPM3_9FUNG|nr:MAG: PUA-like domain-containing protein [Olpidium bornovanus]
MRTVFIPRDPLARSAALRTSSPAPKADRAEHARARPSMADATAPLRSGAPAAARQKQQQQQQQPRQVRRGLRRPPPRVFRQAVTAAGGGPPPPGSPGSPEAPACASPRAAEPDEGRPGEPPAAPAPELRSQCWLMKTEPDSRVVKGKDLAAMKDGISAWDGVRNHEAKNLMKQMRVGDLVLFYHSNTKVPVRGGRALYDHCPGKRPFVGHLHFLNILRRYVVLIFRGLPEAYPDYTAFDPQHPYHDQKSDPENPRWFMVDVQYVRQLKRLVPLGELQRVAAEGGPLKDMALVKRGRLSVQPVTKDEFDFVVAMENR